MQTSLLAIIFAAIVTTQLLGGEVYHYHTKLMMKEAHTGGSFVWHQDYGSVFIIVLIILIKITL